MADLPRKPRPLTLEGQIEAQLRKQREQNTETSKANAWKDLRNALGRISQPEPSDAVTIERCRATLGLSVEYVAKAAAALQRVKRYRQKIASLPPVNDTKAQLEKACQKLNLILAENEQRERMARDEVQQALGRQSYRSELERLIINDETSYREIFGIVFE